MTATTMPKLLPLLDMRQLPARVPFTLAEGKRLSRDNFKACVCPVLRWDQPPHVSTRRVVRAVNTCTSAVHDDEQSWYTEDWPDGWLVHVDPLVLELLNYDDQ